MSGILQGFITTAPLSRTNQGLSLWPKWPRRVGARTRPWLEDIERGYEHHAIERMSNFNTRQHKSAVSDACKAARPTCKVSPNRPARIRGNPRTASTRPTYHVASLGVLSDSGNTSSNIQYVPTTGFWARTAASCKACRMLTHDCLQGQPARVACKGARRCAT